MSGWCNICGEYKMFDSHKCPPMFEVHEEEYHDEDEFKTLRATSEQDAAEKYAEWSDSQGDYDIVQGNETTVRVRMEGKKKWKTFIVSGESVPEYSAKTL